jgi:predicted transcriptional regulator
MPASNPDPREVFSATVTMSVTLPADVAARLAAYCERTRRRESEVLCEALRQRLIDA